MQIYTRAQIVHGTGFAPDARFLTFSPDEAFFISRALDIAAEAFATDARFPTQPDRLKEQFIQQQQRATVLADRLGSL